MNSILIQDAGKLIMDVSDIELIRTLVRLGSLSRATRELNQSQPTLSRRLLRLEDELRTRLFHRSPTGLRATDVARYIVSQAEPMDRQLRQIGRHVELMTRLEAGYIRVGVGPIIEQLLIPDVLRRFIETTGKASITLITETADILLGMLDRSELDIIVGPFDTAGCTAKGYVARQVISDRIIAVARAGHPLFEAASIGPDVLNHYPMVSPGQQGTIRQDAGGPPIGRPKVTADNYSLLQQLTLSLDIICAGPRGIFVENLKNGSLREIDIDLEYHWEGVVVARPETLSTPLVNHFVNLIDAAAGSAGQQG